jgi:hypothetical protein
VIDVKSWQRYMRQLQMIGNKEIDFFSVTGITVL